MKKVKLGDVIDYFISGDWGKEQNSNQTPNKVSCVRGADIDNVNAKQSETIPIRYVKNSSFENKILAIGDIIIEKSGGSPTQSTGRVAFISEKIKNELNHIVCSNFCTAFRVKHEYDALFVYYYFQHIYKSDVFFQFESQTTGIKNLLLDLALTEIPFVDFDKTTQSDIARVLSTFDDKIELNNKINKELENLARTIYEYWFVQNADEKWERKSLYDIATFTNGLACQKFRPKGKDFYKVIKIKEMRNGFTKDTEFVDKNIPKNIIVNDGDILFSWSASLEVMIWAGGIGGLNQHIFKVTSDKFPKSFVYFQLLNYLHHFRIIANNRRTTMGHITIDHLKQSEIHIPPINIIQKVDKTVSPIFEQIIKNRQENAELSRLRDFLLPLLMNGQVTVGQLQQAKSITIPFPNIINNKTTFQTWKTQIGLAARGDIDEQTLHNIYEAIDENDR